MKISDDWFIEDAVSGLRLRVVAGGGQNCLHIERLEEAPIADNRDFFFSKDGTFDGTGSSVCSL